MPASAHKRCSSVSVPLMSPRDTNRALAAAILRRATTASWVAAIPAGSNLGPDKHKVIVHDHAPNTAEAVVHELQFPCFVMHEHDVAFAAFANRERLPRANCSDQHVDAARLRKHRQKVAEQAGLLQRCGRGYSDKRVILGMCPM